MQKYIQGGSGTELSREGFCRNPRGIFLDKVPGELCGGFFCAFFGAFFLGKNRRKIHPKIHGNFQIRIWEFRGQNPHRKDQAMTNWNWKPEPSEPFSPKPKAEPEPLEPFSRNRNRNRNRPFLLNCTETQKTPFCRGTAGTENRNRSNRSTPKP